MNPWESMHIQIYRQQNQLITEQQVNEIDTLTCHTRYKTFHD